MSTKGDITLDQMVQAISKHAVFRDLSGDALQELHKIVSLKTVSKNEDLFEIGDPPDFVFFLLSGSVTLYFPDKTKLEIKPGELIGEIGFLNGDFRLGTLTTNLDSQLIAICGTKIFDPQIVSADTSLIILRKLSKRVTNYLKSLQQTSTKEIIATGESDQVEFKSSLRWNIKAQKKDKAISHAVLKTIAAFLNSAGGILIVGVEDNKNVIGLSEDRFENEDKMLLFLSNIIKTNLGTLHLSNIHFHTEEILGKVILRIDVQSGYAPCYVIYENTEHFYLRTGPSTTELKLSKVYPYIKRRFYAPA